MWIDHFCNTEYCIFFPCDSSVCFLTLDKISLVSNFSLILEGRIVLLFNFYMIIISCTVKILPTWLLFDISQNITFWGEETFLFLSDFHETSTEMLFFFFSSPELIGWDSSRRPCVRACVRACVHTFKHEYLRDQQADYNQILSEASLGLGKGCIRFWCRSDQNSGFNGNG